MDGWTEWFWVMVLTVGGGIAALAFFTQPLLALIGIGAFLMIRWLLQPAEPRRGGIAREVSREMSPRSTSRDARL